MRSGKGESCVQPLGYAVTPFQTDHDIDLYKDHVAPLPFFYFSIKFGDFYIIDYQKVFMRNVCL